MGRRLYDLVAIIGFSGYNSRVCELPELIIVVFLVTASNIPANQCDGGIILCNIQAVCGCVCVARMYLTYLCVTMVGCVKQASPPVNPDLAG